MFLFVLRLTVTRFGTTHLKEFGRWRDWRKCLLKDPFLPHRKPCRKSLNAYPDSTVDIFGHTDNVGSASHNQRLSADRAEGVLNILVDAGVDQGRLRAIGRGEDDPVASNLSAEGRARNRRVEIVIRPIG